MASGKTYAGEVEGLFEGIHGDVAALLDPAKQRRRFPKVGLQSFLKKKKVKALLPAEVPEEVANLLRSTEKLDLVPSELIREFLVEYDAWDLLPENLQRAVEGDRDPRAPTQGSSDFVINRELGDWAEGVVAGAVDASGVGIAAVRYGRRDKLIAGEQGFEELYLEHLGELREFGKRPDILIYRADEAPRESFEGKKAAELVKDARRAVAAFEVRSSHQALTGERPVEKLSFTPKIEDIRNVVHWIQLHGVPDYYVQVLFGRVYAIGFDAILRLLANGPKSGKYRIARVARNQFKSTIYIPLTEGACLSTGFTAPERLTASIKYLPTGRVVVVVEFSGGGIVLDAAKLAELIGLEGGGERR